MLQLHGVTKDFGGLRALDDLSMTIAPGALTGFVGANGAGKSTTMRVVMGLLAADGGRVTWDGAPLTTRTRRRFGYMPEERGLYPKQRVREQLVYFARLHLLSAAAAARRADELLELFDLTARAGDDLEKLSLGNQQRVQIAVALVHDPIALILDEPFSGLDPEAVDGMAALMRTSSEDGVPILFSSHQLDLVERLCDDIVVIARGRVVAAGTAQELRAAHDTVLRLDAPGVGDRVGCSPGVELLRRSRDSVEFVETAPGAGQQLLRGALAAGPVAHYGEVVMPLSEIYKEVVR